jgi:hypothetical protein
MTTLELVDSIPPPPREHWWEYNRPYNFAWIQQRRREADDARAAIQHLYARDDDSATVINEGGCERNSSEDEGCNTNADVNNNNDGEDDASLHADNSNHDDNEIENENMDQGDGDAGIGVSYKCENYDLCAYELLRFVPLLQKPFQVHYYDGLMYNPNDMNRRRRTNENEMPDYRINRYEEHVPDETLSAYPEGNVPSSPSVFDLPTPPISNTVDDDDETPPLPPLIQRISNNDWEPDCPPNSDTLVETMGKEDN